MSESPVEQESAEQRAAEAAEALAAEGTPVTGRAVRARSGVRMAVAVEAARIWNERETRAGLVPDPPPAVEARFAALWREAYTIARGEFEQARTGWQAKLQQSEAERSSMAEDVEQLETQRDEALRTAATTVEQAAAAATTAAADLATQRSRADKAEASIETMTGERKRLIAERDRQQTDLEKGRAAIEAARQETAVARSAEAEARQARVAAETRASELSTKLTETEAARDNAQRTADRYQAEAAETARQAQEASADAATAVQDLNKEQGRREHAEAEAQRLRGELATAQERIRSLETLTQPKK